MSVQVRDTVFPSAATPKGCRDAFHYFAHKYINAGIPDDTITPRKAHQRNTERSTYIYYIPYIYKVYTYSHKYTNTHACLKVK